MPEGQHLSALSPGMRLDRYTIGSVLGAGGFGITYRAREDITDRAVAIKEYLPTALAVRDRNGATVRPLSEGAARDFGWGLERFRQEARLLIELRHPNIVPVLAYFEANATGYLVMEFQDGASLGEHLRARDALSEAETLGIAVPLLDGVEEVHRRNVLHRDIKPDNIFVRRDGTPVLLDFGAARQALGEHSKSLTTLLTEGYAPFEQYAGTGNQGPWSDIYALAAVMFRCLAGGPPAEAPRRAVAKLRGRPDPMAADFQALRGAVSSDLAFAIEAGLRVVEHERPQTVAAFRDLIVAPAPVGMRLMSATAAAASVSAPMALPTAAPSPTLIPDLAHGVAALSPVTWRRPERRKPRRMARLAVLGAIAAAAASGAAYVGDQRNWLPAAFRQAGSQPTAPAAPDDTRAKASRHAPEDAEATIRRDKALADYQQRQLDQIDAERRHYFEAQKSDAERRRLEEEKARAEAERKRSEGDTTGTDDRARPDAGRGLGDSIGVDRRPPPEGGAQRDAERARRPDTPPRGAPPPRRYDTWPPAAPGQPPAARRADPPSLAPGDGRDYRRSFPDQPPARGRVPPDWRPPGYDDQY